MDFKNIRSIRFEMTNPDDGGTVTVAMRDGSEKVMRGVSPSEFAAMADTNRKSSISLHYLGRKWVPVLGD